MSMLYPGNEKIDDFYNRFYGSRVLRCNQLQVLIPLLYVTLYNRNGLSKKDKSLYRLANQILDDTSRMTLDGLKNELKNFNNDDLWELTWYIARNSLGNEGFLSGDSTESQLVDLIYHLLNIKNGDTLFDLGSGSGTLLANLLIKSLNDDIKCSSVFGVERQNKPACISLILLGLLCDGDIDFDIAIQDGLVYQDFQYTKGYTYPPTGQHLLFRMTKDYKSLLYPDITFSVAYHEQWIYIDRLLAGLTGPNPRAVAFVFGKTLMSTDRNEFLQRLLDDGWIEGIIELSEGVVKYVESKTYLIVFSRNNKGVRFLSTDIDKQFILRTSVGNDPYSYKWLNSNLLFSAYKSFDKNKNYQEPISRLKKLPNLLPFNVINHVDDDRPDNDIVLGNVAQILVGCQYTQKNFEIVGEDTGYKILTASDIEDGSIQESNLKYVVNNKHLGENVYACLGDVIITTKSTKIKVAVVTSNEYKLIVTGGMIIVRMDIEKLDPYYLQMFLESDWGIAALKTMQTGNHVIHISPDILKDLRIPYLDIQEQHKKARRYFDILGKIELDKVDAQSQREKLKYILITDDDK